MKKIFDKIYLLLLTMVFSFGGYYVGSRDQKIDIALPGPGTPTVSQSFTSPASVVKSKVAVQKSSSPVQNTVSQTANSQTTGSQTTSSQQTAQATTPAPTPRTAVS